MAHTMTLNGFKVESFTYPITANEGWRKNAVIIKAGPNPKYPLAWCEITPKGLCGANFPIRPGEKDCTVLRFKGRFMEDGLEEIFRISAA